MIPIRDENPTRTTPVVNYLLIAANIVVFILMALAGPGNEAQVYQFAMIPAQITAGLDLGDIADIFTSMFMHAGLAHVAGNMLYLWIFGDNVEDSMGHGRYLVFYLLGGVVASITHLITNPYSNIPTVGASGAIAAALGAYLVLFPSSRVVTFIPLGFFLHLTTVPAVVVLGLWFVLQFFQGIFALGMPDGVGGVAFWAHIGGFLAGVVLAKLFARRQQSSYYASRW
jgi:membrane associated rhomboid family serine protease